VNRPLNSLPIYRITCWTALFAALAWVCWAPLAQMASRWSIDPSYSHGFLVPFISLYLLWRRRDRVKPAPPAIAWGVLFLAIGAALKIAASALLIQTLAHYSLPFFMAGVCLVLGGWANVKWAWPSIVFLFCMVPLPGALADRLGGPLQRVATTASTYAIQVLGVPAVDEGNVILLSESRIGVAEACSGLRMLVLFATLALGVVLLFDRKPWEKALILASAVPIAIVANVSRITLTAAMYEWVSAEAAEMVFHDLAGWLMMPFAVVMLFAELRLLSGLMTEPPSSAPLSLGAASETNGARPPAATSGPPATSGPATTTDKGSKRTRLAAR
jgi:exosortase